MQSLRLGARLQHGGRARRLGIELELLPLLGRIGHRALESLAGRLIGSLDSPGVVYNGAVYAKMDIDAGALIGSGHKGSSTTDSRSDGTVVFIESIGD